MHYGTETRTTWRQTSGGGSEAKGRCRERLYIVFSVFVYVSVRILDISSRFADNAFSNDSRITAWYNARRKWVWCCHRQPCLAVYKNQRRFESRVPQKKSPQSPASTSQWSWATMTWSQHKAKIMAYLKPIMTMPLATRLI